MRKTINLRGFLLDLSRPIVMGILNVTPDSFYDGGCYMNEKDIIQRAEQIIKEGADIIDIGAYSTRPGAQEVPIEVESKRIISAVRAVIHSFPYAYISVDTFRASIAHKALTEGAAMVNDISAGNLDKDMLTTVAQHQVPYVLMHMQGTPKTMIHCTQYNNLLLDIAIFFQQKISMCTSMGIKDIIIDPGFGFSKTIEQNYTILKNLTYFHHLDQPILLGISRKSMIYKILEKRSKEVLNGTTVLNTIGLMQGASILRVHDVKEAIETITLFKKVFT